ncbi:hypothetical protein HY218_00360 [Candidatus Saccharibacteria bacterium]|nr:hypothetical protein [Candidatus Saccharibacteria bacterium]
MEHTYWHKQSPGQPLFPDLLWSRPENKAQAGKLLIIGGNLHGFSAPARAYMVAQKAGSGTTRILLPDAIKKTVVSLVEDGEFAPSTPSGSFSQKALDEWLNQATWADGVLVSGDLGHNSETAIVLEKFLTKYIGQVTITKEGIDYLTTNLEPLQNRVNTTLVLSLSQLQRLLTALKSQQAVSLSMPLLQFVDLLHQLTTKYQFSIITKHHGQLIVASDGHISTTATHHDESLWCIDTAARAAVWWLQNPTKTFEALTTAVYEPLSGS